MNKDELITYGLRLGMKYRVCESIEDWQELEIISHDILYQIISALGSEFTSATCHNKDVAPDQLKTDIVAPIVYTVPGYYRWEDIKDKTSVPGG